MVPVHRLDDAGQFRDGRFDDLFVEDFVPKAQIAIVQVGRNGRAAVLPVLAGSTARSAHECRT